MKKKHLLEESCYSVLDFRNELADSEAPRVSFYGLKADYLKGNSLSDRFAKFTKCWLLFSYLQGLQQCNSMNDQFAKFTKSWPLFNYSHCMLVFKNSFLQEL